MEDFKNVEITGFYQIAISLAEHFASVYYVEIESENFVELIPSKLHEKNPLPKSGNGFFDLATAGASKYVHPDDLEMVLKKHNKDAILAALSKSSSYSLSIRVIIDGKVLHVRHIDIMCEDKKHIIFCMENVEAEYQEREVIKKTLQSAERMARLDELTGIKNKNAFFEQSKALDERIKSEANDVQFAVLMCDLNNLKTINDVMGHAVGDEVIQKTSRMICDVFKHSPVFRIGGDEFAVVLSGKDYEERDVLLSALKKESCENKRFHSGPVVACGMSVFEKGVDKDFLSVFQRSDKAMYLNKSEIKSHDIVKTLKKMELLEKTIPAERKRKLDNLFDALLTVAGESYIYLNDMRYDYSRWSLALIDDFALESEYMYHADLIWQRYVHTEDIEMYKNAVKLLFCPNTEWKPFCYRARKPDGSYALLTTRGFVLYDETGKPEYFGGIIIKK